jgi:heme exporter protein D
MLSSVKFSMLVWIAYAISVCALQAADLLSSVLQLQHGTWGLLS